MRTVEQTGAAESAPRARTTQVIRREEPDEEPTYHLYRPSGQPPTSDPDE
jgi:hypothetical protein